MSDIDWAAVRSHFHVPDGCTYLDGNSLGLLSDAAETELMRALNEWRALGIGGWGGGNPPWLRMSREVAGGFAPLIGADPANVVAHGSTTLMLHQLLSTLFQPRPGRDRIVIDGLAFPTDNYAVESHLRLRGLDPATHLLRVESDDGFTLDEDRIIEAMDQPGIGLVLLPGVLYASGQLLDMPRLAKAARRRGSLIGFDCSHSIGSVPHAMKAWGADFAFWCGYKYLNGGPGCAAGAFLHPRHNDCPPGLAGWFGSSDEAMFKMERQMTPAQGAKRLELGSPHVLSLAPLLGSLRVANEVGIEAIRARSLELTTYLMEQAGTELAARGFAIVTPPEPIRRGGHVAITHPEAENLVKALTAQGIVTDFRYPDVIRVAPVALYNTVDELDHLVTALLSLTGSRR